MNEPNSEPKARLCRQLNFERRFEVREYIRKNRHDICERRPTFAALAEEMTKALGFPVRETHVRTMSRHACVKWTPLPSKRPSPKAASAGALAVIASAGALAVIARAVESLHVQLAAEVPADLRELLAQLNSAPSETLPPVKGDSVSNGTAPVSVGGNGHLGANGAFNPF